MLTVEAGQRGKALDELLAGKAVVGFRDRAKFLGISTTALHRAFNGGPADVLVAGVMAVFPRRYHQIFTEVTDDAAPQTKAA